MSIARTVLLSASALSLAACATTSEGVEQAPLRDAPVNMSAAAQTARVVAEAAEASDQHDRLFALFARSDAAYLDRNPTAAFYRGDFSDADRLGEFTTAALLRERQAAEQNLAALGTIDRAALSEEDRIYYDVFRYGQERTLAETSPEILAFEAGLAVDHFRGLHISYPRLSAPGGLMPFATVQDYENNLSRHGDFVRAMDAAIARMRLGAANGITEPRLTVELMIQQLATQLALPEERNPYYAPLRAFPDGFSAAEKERLTARYREVVGGQLMPALEEFRTFLTGEYLPKARPTGGVDGMADGGDYYRFRIEEMTTLPLTADEVHALGLSEVARINRELAQARAEAGDREPTYYRSKDELTAAWYALAERVDPKLDALFSDFPETQLEIKPYEEYREAFNLAASYMSGKPGARPGTFYFSGYNPTERDLSPSIALYMHEGNPGHHFETMLAIENEDIPAFMRYGGFTAYSEGWGLYAESLGYELGLYDDPLDRIGALAGGELLRAVRLVVDTGMHAKGWSRERAIEYMVENGQPRDFAESETARYLVMPAQALAYKIGELKIKELRAKAAAALGDDFDVRDFHAQVLGSGDIPLPVLEAKIDRWIAAGGG
ncbi:DUF885 domain-containing protein [Erythrobacter litoralis]|uniref:DUF885 domain-containing protein n=1 Tax=Erythrobacter litoralis TaxID=39960 RepID=UPI002435CF53|nr:DUF885 domain-containing protein [Erythrobacter litoralis]MDG6077863.1 DUF885 domain-containing protein [Erythrobacter litoralis]